ncbi:MAG: S41 family peptidase [Saprospiraceae bacterium]|nr:S41 family peptidase [Saprospiraceae bacterium]
MISNKNEKIRVWQPLALSLMLAIGMLFGYKMNDRDQGSLIEFVDHDSSPAAVGEIEELIRFIETRYVDSVDRDFLVEKAINAVLGELDPHSVYISPEQLRKVNDEMEGTFRGIGVEIFYIEDTVNVISTIPEGPADRAGIKPFDKLIMINDSIVAGQGLKFGDIRKMLRGDIGDELSIKLLSKEKEEKTANIVINDIPVHSVKGGIMVDETTGYIKIDRFGSKTYSEFMDYFQSLTEEEGMKNIIIDLRNNPGGYLPQATNILSQLFKQKGSLLVYTKGNNDRKFEYKSTGKTFFPIDKVSVLIDENSASGSEILAGAIQDWDRGVIIGRRSFGKGLVQEQYNLSNSGALRLTIARYYTPSGRSIQRTYEDMDSYYTDYEDRYYSGEFFSEDSISKGNSKEFETMELKRPVFGGGGITPDIFIPIDSLLFDPFYAEVMGDLPQYVYRKISNGNEEEILANIDQVVQNIFDQYILHKETETNKKELSNLSSYIKDEIRSNLIRFISGDKEMVRLELQSDPFMKAALDYFHTEGKLTDLLDKTILKN